MDAGQATAREQGGPPNIGMAEPDAVARYVRRQMRGPHSRMWRDALPRQLAGNSLTIEGSCGRAEDQELAFEPSIADLWSSAPDLARSVLDVGDQPRAIEGVEATIRSVPAYPDVALAAS